MLGKPQRASTSYYVRVWRKIESRTPLVIGLPTFEEHNLCQPKICQKDFEASQEQGEERQCCLG